MVKRHMCLRSFINFLIYPLVALYILTPVLDSTACAQCAGALAPRAAAALDAPDGPRGEAAYAGPEGTRSQPPGTETTPSSCSLCDSAPIGVDGFASSVHLPMAQWEEPSGSAALPVLDDPIDKPPQNIRG